MSPSIQYLSFLIRLWREAAAGRSSTAADWQSEVEHIQTGQRSDFDTLDQLLDFLRLQIDDLGKPQLAPRGRTQRRGEVPIDDVHPDSRAPRR